MVSRGGGAILPAGADDLRL